MGLENQVVLIEDGGHVSVGDGLAVVDDVVYFTADSDLRSNGLGFSDDAVVTSAVHLQSTSA